ncbi:type I pullulanase [Thermobrachium celere]|uniref:type I pullulanase n=1 Tax=Thermobrachium celere TaxID=53422 RepID=UPI0019421758|nr:type I pullulanase [Thermobrachium celere]GFR34959.1 type I pullulanase [Thermobrachium celere]
MMYAYLSSFNQIIVHGVKENKIRINKNTKIKIFQPRVHHDIKSVYLNGNELYINLKNIIDITQESSVSIEGHIIKINYSPLFKTEEFNNLYAYDGPLGYIYNKNYTEFFVWSPVAKEINLLLFKGFNPSIDEEPIKYRMQRLEKGVFYVKVDGDLENLYYNYEALVYEDRKIVVDPYTPAVSINGLRGAIVDLAKTNPEGFENDQYVKLNNYVDAVIYEISIRDFTIDSSSCVNLKGKYLGLIEENTKLNGFDTGLSHIKDLGVTHLQIMPMFDFSYKSVDEKYPLDKYNWGYDPQNYNCPEGSYSINAFCPKTRIIELKKLIQKLHSIGIGVNMDVVYNHMFEESNTHFEGLVPGYYFRKNLDGTFINGSGCGNDTASENYMMRRYIIDSVKFWVKEYHIDGFRFDLMGLHDIETMKKLEEEVHKINPYAMLYGEGWNIPTGIDEEFRAIQKNSYKLKGIGFFNDTIRNVVRGSVFEYKEKGFVSGALGLEETLKDCIKGLPYLYTSPCQSINYVSCHDNHILWDKLNLSNPQSSFEDLKAMQKLAYAIVLTSQGVPFIHSGDEFLRTKQGVENSYNSPDSINKVDWNLKVKNIDVYTYFKELISFRKKHPAFRMFESEMINNHIEFLDSPKGTIIYMIKGHANGDLFKDIIVIYNAQNKPFKFNLPQGRWYLYVDKNNIYKTPIKNFELEIETEPISLTILSNTYTD